MTASESRARILAALRRPKTGQFFDLSVPITNDSRWPGHGPVVHSVSLSHRQGAALINGGHVGMMTDRIDMPLHAGTHMDAPNHFSVSGQLAGGRTVEESEVSYALGQGHFSGVDTVPVFIGDAVLLDVTAVLPAEALDTGGRIDRAALLAAASRQGIDTLPAGGAVIVHTGWGELFEVDRRRYFSGEPGMTLDAAELLIESGVRMVGADNHAFEPYPDSARTEAGPYPAHQRLLVASEIPILENVRTKELHAAGVDRFLLVVAPLRVRGGSGSPVTPIAIA